MPTVLLYATLNVYPCVEAVDAAPGQINGNGVENIWHVATVSNYTGASTNSATTAKNIATNSTAPNALKTNTTATTSNTTAGKVVNTSKSSAKDAANLNNFAIYITN